jgi:hypothetical protein
MAGAIIHGILSAISMRYCILIFPFGKNGASLEV